jgi:hypothetical protein
MDEHRKGNVTALRSIVTENMIEGIREEVQKHQQQQKDQMTAIKTTTRSKNNNNNQNPVGAPVLRKAFTVKGFGMKPSILQMRHGFVGTGKRTQNTGFGQVTVLINSIRNLVQVDTAGNIIGGAEDEDNVIEVKIPSLVVYEVGFGDPNCNWRIARVEEIDQGKKKKEEES